jgi:hypothetical protein
MEKHEIVVGEPYAYLTPGMTPHQPLKAVVMAEPEGGYVEVTLYHPDTGQSEERVKTRELVGGWDDEPEVRFGQYERPLEAAHERDETLTWAMIAEQRHAQVSRQRALAVRLSRFGITRAGRHYAGQGGSSAKPHDADLQLNYDEIELLLERAERGPGVSYIPQGPEANGTAVPATDEVAS